MNKYLIKISLKNWILMVQEQEINLFFKLSKKGLIYCNFFGEFCNTIYINLGNEEWNLLLFLIENFNIKLILPWEKAWHKYKMFYGVICYNL